MQVRKAAGVNGEGRCREQVGQGREGKVGQTARTGQKIMCMCAHSSTGSVW